MLLVLLACGGTPSGPEKGPEVSESAVPFLVPTGDTAIAATGDSAVVDTGPPAPTGTGETADTGLGPWVGHCELSDHPLVAVCEVVPELPVTVTVTRPDGATRQFDGPGGSLVLWGLPPETALDWAASHMGVEVATGSFVTGALPADLAAVGWEVSGDEPSVDALLLPVSCESSSYAAIVATDGTVLWYADTGSGPKMVVWTGDGVLALPNREEVLGFGMDGTPRLQLVRDEAFEGPIHHDVAHWMGWTFALTARETIGVDGAALIMDGFHVFDAEGTLHTTWWLEEHLGDDLVLASRDGPVGRFWGSEFEGAEDWAHANGLSATPDGDLILSLRYLDSVWRIVGDPLAPDFGAVRWRLSGTDAAPSDFDLPVDTFVGQHHAAMEDDRFLTLYDNRESPERSRTLRIELDPAAGTAEVVETHRLPLHCNNQGGYFVLPDGGALATCPPEDRLWTFGEDFAPRFTLQIQCPDTLGGQLLSRAVPLQLWAPGK